MDLKFTIRKVRVAGLGVGVGKLVSKIRWRLARARLLARDRSNTTYGLDRNQPDGSFVLFDKADADPIIWQNQSKIIGLADKFCRHEFNLLGSGWVNADASDPGNEINKSNAAESARIATLLPMTYKRIDWQQDFKSSWRWSAGSWYKSITYGDRPRADIKVPWELGRMQHLPMLAMAAMIEKSKSSTGDKGNKYFIEIKNQIIDFISANPPRYGVQWMVSMEVAIRAANMLYCLGMLNNAGFALDPEFLEIFWRSIYGHGSHIAGNLEWSGGMPGNHYFANIVGLMFIAACLPANPETSSWLAFSVDELARETGRQFLGDGGNFEASTAYHCFTTEMLMWALRLLGRLPQDKISAAAAISNVKLPGRGSIRISKSLLTGHEGHFVTFPNEFVGRIGRIIDFTRRVMTGAGAIDQIGDNDSGRFIIEDPSWLAMDDDLKSTKPRDYLLALIDRVEATGLFGSAADKVQKPSELDQFNDFGLYIYNKPGYHLAVRCGSIGQRGKGGHAHNDQLSITLKIANGGRNGFTDVLVDPGTFVYTASAADRNVFRATRYHNTLQAGAAEQNPIPRGLGDALFWLGDDRARARIINISPDEFHGCHQGFGAVHERKLAPTAGRISGLDTCAAPGVKTISFHLAPGIAAQAGSGNIHLYRDGARIASLVCDEGMRAESYRYSPEYGVALAARVVRITSSKTAIAWTLELT